MLQPLRHKPCDGGCSLEQGLTDARPVGEIEMVDAMVDLLQDVAAYLQVHRLNVKSVTLSEEGAVVDLDLQALGAFATARNLDGLFRAGCIVVRHAGLTLRARV